MAFVHQWESWSSTDVASGNAVGETGRLRGEMAVRQALLTIFCDPVPEPSARLRELPASRWRRLLPWLDRSGLALYFLDRLTDLQCTDWLPAEILERLDQNLADNTERTQSLIAESAAIQKQFQGAGVRYAILKGPSFCPIAVPRLELRCQFDLDFLVMGADGIEARRLLEQRGYYFHPGHPRAADVNSDVVWRFTCNEKPGSSLRDIYKAMPSFAVELHLESEIEAQRSLLAHAMSRDLFGMRVPVLSAADLFLSQGMHAFKHLRLSFSRISHLLEFRRQVLARRNEIAFWQEVRSLGEKDGTIQDGLGVVILAITKLMGEFAPPELTSWTVDQLPVGVRLWVEMYARRAVLASYPGTKLNLLLNRELAGREPVAAKSLRRGLLPLHLPQPPIRAVPNECLSFRLGRYRMHLGLILNLLPLHTVEGLRCLWHARKFSRRVAALAK